MRGNRNVGPAARAAALALFAGALAPGASARQWAVAPPGPCAEAPARDLTTREISTHDLCKAGACAAEALPLRGRFDPTSVASGPETARIPLPDAGRFPGPGACVEAGNVCGKTVPSAGALAASPPVVEQPPVPVKPPGVP